MGARRFLGACLAVSVLALAAGIGTSRAQAAPEVIPWDEAELAWTPPTTYAGTGGSLADCGGSPCGVLYIVEAQVSGGPGWGPLALVDGTHYRATDLRAGVWQFRIRAYFKGSGYSAPGPVVTKTILEPVAAAPPTTTAK